MWTTFLQKLKDIGASCSVYAAAGTIFLYFLGYLVLRLQLSTWGVETDLGVLDDRYLFAGARFLVYLVSSAMNAIFVGAPLFALWWLLNRSPRFQHWRKSWNYALCGVVFAFLFIQLVERKCFELMKGLLLQPSLEGDSWLKAVLRDGSSRYEPFFSVVLVMGVMIAAWLLLQARSSPVRRPALEAILVSLVVIEFLFLPANYGIIISTRELPKVTQFAPAEAWLVWEGKERMTFLVVDNGRKLVSIPNGDVKKLEITGVSQIFRRLFPENGR